MIMKTIKNLFVAGSFLLFSSIGVASEKIEFEYLKVEENISNETRERAIVLEKRLKELNQELKAKDFSKDKKKVLKKEIKDIKQEVREMDGVHFYIGGGALVIIILLLILL